MPVKDLNAYYPIKSNTFCIKTRSITGGENEVALLLYDDWDVRITSIRWRFKDWKYTIQYCTGNYHLKFPVTPPTGVNKTWEITFATEDIKIKCNTLQVLHFIFNNTHFDECTSRVKGKKAAKVKFFHNLDTATEKFKSDPDGM